jgi:hypothetical protein
MAQKPQDWSAPVGGASPVIFTFWNVQKVHLTLRAQPKPGEVMVSWWWGEQQQGGAP